MKPVIQQYLQHVGQTCPLLGEEVLAVFARGLEVQELAPKAFLRRVGETAPTMAYVANGLIKAFYVDENGEQININFLREGMYAGDYLAFAKQQTSKYSFQCLEYCTLIHFSHAHREQCVAKIPAIEGYFRRMIEQALVNYLQRTESFLLADAHQRYLHFLQTQPDLFRRISVSDLCSYLGIRRQTLTRIRKNMLEPTK